MSLFIDRVRAPVYTCRKAVAVADLYHINFHTFQNKPIFLDVEYARAIDQILFDVVERHSILQLARAIMPTHVHCIIAAFPDQSRADIVQRLKGASAKVFLERYPDVSMQLGGHLWQEGYDWVLITTHRQLRKTVAYIEANRPKIGLPPLSEPLP